MSIEPLNQVKSINAKDAKDAKESETKSDPHLRPWPSAFILGVNAASICRQVRA
jgi:hypothetical protein